MKKLLSAVIPLCVCGIMLAGCGGTGSQETSAETSAETTSAAAETTSEATTEATTEAATEATTEATEEKAAEAAGSSYGSIEEFAADPAVFDLPSESVSASESLIYNFVKTFEGAEEMYLDAVSTDGSVAATLAVSGSGMYMKSSDGAQSITMIITDSKLYMLDDSQKAGYYSALTEDEASQFDTKELMSEFADLDMDEEINNAEDVKFCTVKIDGKDYRFETAETDGGFLFDGDTLSAIIAPDSSNGFNALIINEFSSKVPDGIFDIPEDYQIVDMAQAAQQ